MESGKPAHDADKTHHPVAEGHTLAAERARHSYLEHILANVNDAIIIIDPATHILEWNAAAERIYGWAGHEVQGKRLEAVIPTRYLDGSTSVDAVAALNQHGLWTGLVAHPHRDGHEVIIDSAVRYLRDAAGAMIGLVGINRDVTARVRAEEALRHSEANLRAFFESAPESYFLLDRDYRIIAFNRVTSEQVRATWQRDVAEGDSILRYVHPDHHEAFSEHYQRCLNGETFRYERAITYAPGQTTWYQLTYTPISLSGDGAITGVAFSGLDVTARKQTELALAHREAQLAGIIDSAMDAIINGRYRPADRALQPCCRAGLWLRCCRGSWPESRSLYSVRGQNGAPAPYSRLRADRRHPPLDVLSRHSGGSAR